THTFYTTGLSIAVSRENSGGMFSLLLNVFSMQFLKAVGALVVVLLIFGVLVWLFERRKNPEEFGGSTVSGILSGFWWSAVTMTTVGYGDKSPRTVGGRVLALIWMFMAIIIISSFTAGIASALTLNQLQGKINGPGDLNRRDVRVGTVGKSTSAAWLDGERIDYRAFNTVAEGLDALSDGRLEAM
ncbi:MAG: ion transporter, partial [Calditrichaeota bacterium]|nr:ion transporter [Calditrichota bacterium]